jgi:hypothetical protein
MTIVVLNFSQQHTRMCDWKTFKGSEEFHDQVKKGDNLGKGMAYERKQQMRENI